VRAGLGEVLAAQATAPPLEWWLALAVLAGLGAFAFYGAFQALRRARLVEDLPTSRARSAAQGLVELAGHAEALPGDPVVAPLSGRPCVWYRFQVQERQKDRVTGEIEWHTLETGVSDALFRLVDDTGQCVLDPDHAEVTPALRDRWRGSAPRPAGPPPRGGGAWLGRGDYRYQEELIRPGDPLHAVGTLRSVRGGTDDLPVADEVRETLVAWKRDPSRMRALDTDGDGRVNLEEWQAARRAAREEVIRERGRHAADPSTPVLGADPLGARPYLLAAVTQTDLARRYRWSALARIALFFMATSACVWLLQAGPAS